MRKPSPKKRIFAQLARMAKALAHAHRLDLIEVLGQGERSVEELADAVGLSVANASHHLQVLKDGGLARARREGVRIFYALTDDDIAGIVADLGRVAERRVAEVDRILREEFASRDAAQPVDQKELLRLVKSNDVTVLDVRPEGEYRAGHIAGAVNIPLPELARRLAELPRGKQVVAYCRGPYCLLSFDAVRRLRAKGFRARRLADGFPEWKAARGPVGRRP
ncbi:MAG: metalloregulator ArsR/SmtB family transcription factor [Alphaproteobacteria bacterium]|nr:metalloregulator ArsR/SmtB family transcription factor [Alphaproteobacteria bacterium]